MKFFQKTTLWMRGNPRSRNHFQAIGMILLHRSRFLGFDFGCMAPWEICLRDFSGNNSPKPNKPPPKPLLLKRPIDGEAYKSNYRRLEKSGLIVKSGRINGKIPDDGSGLFHLTVKRNHRLNWIHTVFGRLSRYKAFRVAACNK